MGSACCVAAKGRSVPERTGGEGLRQAGYSPKHCFRLNGNNVPITREIENPSYQNSQLTSRNVSVEFKGSLSSERGHLLDGGSTLENSATPLSQKSTSDDTLVPNLTTTPSDLSISSKISTMNSVESSIPNRSFSIPPVFSVPTLDPSLYHNYGHHPNSTPSRRAHRSPGHPLLRQISDSQISGLKSPGNSISDARPSFVFSPCSNEMVTGSLCGSSDGWSMRTFSEMVVSSQREIWSSDSEYLGSGHHKIIGSSSSSRFLYSPSMDQQSCGTCTRPLTELPNFVARSDVSCVAILVCGHAYHAECLESRTPEANKFDPACPACMVGDNHLSKSSRKDIRVESETKGKHQKISRSRVADSYLDSNVNVSEPQRDIERVGKVSKMEPSSSTRSSYGKPFLKKHFSFRSKSNRTLPENNSTRTKGFWGRHRKE